MLRVLQNQRMDTNSPSVNTSNSSQTDDHDDDLPAPPSSRNINPAPPSSRNVKMKVPLRRTSSQQQRLRPKPMAITTISEDAPLQEAPSANRRKNGVRRRSSHEKDKSPKRSSSGKEKKGVHWNHRVEKKRHHRLQDLSPDEKEAVWYTENDTKIILAMAKVTVKMMMRGEACDDVDYCSRGLEGKTPAGSKQRQKNKLRVRKALITEQEMQREEGVHDPEYLAQVSIKNSKDVCMHAHKVAVRDEEEIREYVSSVMNQLDHIPVQPRRGKR